MTELSINQVRIIGYDSAQVFYETWWEHINDWGNKNSLKKKIIYYRTSSQRVLSSSEFIRIDTLSNAEIKVHRPDLPLSVCCNESLYWTDKRFSTVSQYEKYLLKNEANVTACDVLNIPELIIVPFGLKRALKKSILINAVNGKAFSYIELLWHAHNVQAPYINGKEETGIGLHRLGFEKGIPSFYIGSYDPS